MSEVVARSSPIGGIGVFAVERIDAGEVIRDFTIEREITAEAPLRPEHGERPEHCPSIGGRRYLIASPDRYFNHSCDPNAYLRYGTEGTQVVARREVAAGEELTFDYLINNGGGDSWPCNCGAARCRGKTGHSFFDLPDEVRREYTPLLAPWFVAEFGARLGLSEADVAS